MTRPAPRVRVPGGVVAVTVAVLVAVVGGLPGPSTARAAHDHLASQLATEHAAPAPTAPEPTAAAAPEPTAAPVAPDDPADGADAGDGTAGDDGIDWWPIVLASVLAVVLIVVLGALLGGRRRSSARPAASRPQPPDAARSEALHMPTQVQVLTTAQWIHDQLTLELLASSPSAASARWLVERSQLDDTAVGAEQHYLAGDGDNWERLSHTLSALAAALDTHLQVRNQAPIEVRLVEETAEVVHRDRSVLQQLVTVLWPTARG